MANKYSFDAEIIAKNHLEELKTALDFSENELKELRAGTEAISKEIASIDYEILKLVTANNNDIDFLKGLYDARLATQATLTAFNSTYSDQYGRVSTDPRTSPVAAAFNTFTAWPGGIVPNYVESSSTSTNENGETVTETVTGTNWVIGPRSCSIKLNKDDHWDGESYTYDTNGFREEVLVCPNEEQKPYESEHVLEKKTFTARGYDIEGSTDEIGVKLVEVEITNSSLGVGTVSYFKKEKIFLDVGVNPNNNSFSYDGDTYSANISEGSGQYNSVIKPILDKISERNAIINDYFEFVIITLITIIIPPCNVWSE